MTSFGPEGWVKKVHGYLCHVLGGEGGIVSARHLSYRKKSIMETVGHFGIYINRIVGSKMW